jgi:hypothetical protein
LKLGQNKETKNELNTYKNTKENSHGDIILRREPYKCKMKWDNDLTEAEKVAAENAITCYGGYLDKGAPTWYTLDKDIKIFSEKAKRTYPLSYKSKLIEKMPGLPKETRLYLNLEKCGADYEFAI